MPQLAHALEPGAPDAAVRGDDGVGDAVVAKGAAPMLVRPGGCRGTMLVTPGPEARTVAQRGSGRGSEAVLVYSPD